MNQKHLTPNHFHNTRVVYFDQHGLVVSVQECRRHGKNMTEATTFQLLERFVNFEVSCKFFRKDGTWLPIQDLAISLANEQWSSEEIEREIVDDKLIIHYQKYRAQIQIHTYQPKGNISGTLIEDWLTNIPKEVMDFLLALNPQGPTYNFIPAGFGWDGRKTHLDLYYMFKMRQLLIGRQHWEIETQVIESLSEQYAYSPLAQISTDWKQAKICRPRSYYDIGKISEQSEVFVFFQNDSMSLHEKSINREQYSFKIPVGFDRAIVVITNTTSRDSRQHGLCVRLYKEQENV